MSEVIEQVESKTLFAKMARIMSKVERLKKTGHNNFFNYDFATESDVADTMRPLLAEENIIILPDMTSVEQVTYQSDKGKTTWRTRCTFVFTLACGDTGATRSCSWSAEADDLGDKGINKCATAALKFFLLKTFVMSTGDELDESDNDHHLGEQKKQGQQRQQQKPAKKPISDHWAHNGGGVRQANMMKQLNLKWDDHKAHIQPGKVLEKMSDFDGEEWQFEARLKEIAGVEG